MSDNDELRPAVLALGLLIVMLLSAVIGYTVAETVQWVASYFNERGS